MDATITTLGDIFKNKVANSLDVPTIWVDLDGNEHEDYEHYIITSFSALQKYEKLFDQSNDIVLVNDHLEAHRCLRVCGIIKQIGSHVTRCYKLNDFSDKQYPYDLKKTFRFARSLTYLKDSISKVDSDEEPLVIPEDLFWNCPNLKEVIDCFNYNHCSKIPENLFSGCPDLQSVRGAFSACQNLTEVPKDLFKNNKKLTDLSWTFGFTGLSEISKELLAPFIDGLLDGSVKMDHMLYATPLSRNVYPALKDNEKINKEKENLICLLPLKEQSFPENVPLEKIWDLL